MSRRVTSPTDLRSRRVRVEKGIYRRYGGNVFEIGYYDEEGKQRWRTVDGGIEEARRLRYELHSGRGRNYRLRADLLRVSKLAEILTPSKREIVDAIKATHGTHQREAWLRLAALSLSMARRLER